MALGADGIALSLRYNQLDVKQPESVIRTIAKPVLQLKNLN